MSDNYQKILSRQKYFDDTYFDLLMSKRIRQVLLLCSNYDAFALEEDGRIDEQIFNEYASLNLRYPPLFRQVNSEREAFEVLDTSYVDLVIIMVSMGSFDPFRLARTIKKQYTNKPVVLLTHFSREVLLKLDSGISETADYIFSWLGNSDILLAIIKLIEDRMNAEFDINDVGVQGILLVEDSIRYYSSYLPNIYKILFSQSKRFMTEGLNEHQKMLRMRGRPKILLATSYEEAIDLYEKYSANILGVISDISYLKDGKENPEAGLILCKTIKERDEFMPFLLQSSDVSNENAARELGAKFLNKYSKTLSIELRNYIIRYLNFGDFIFRDPKTFREINRAIDLKSLQEVLFKIPDDCLEYHISENHFSKWLNARALFPLARIFRDLTREDFKNISEIRNFLYETIANFRRYKGRGIIANFNKATFDEYLIFARVGDGSIGGKARGLAFIDSFIKKHRLFSKYKDVTISIPKTVVLSTEVFDEFMESNHLYKIALSDLPDEQILLNFIGARLPSRVHQDLYAFISVAQGPIAVRSSSLLEDSHYQPFAGIYNTYMIPRPQDNDPQLCVKYLSDAIKSVYASVFYQSSKAYMDATSHVIDEEKMAIILQQVCGTQYKNHFYPAISGVARSINFYPIEQEKAEDGIVNIAYGLGKYIVDGGMALRFSPKYPKKVLQLSSPELALKETQKYLYAIDMSVKDFIPSTDDSNNLLKLKVREVEEDKVFRFAASTFDFQNNILRDGMLHDGKRLITFASILKHNTFPLSDILQDLLKTGQNEMSNPVEMEFAVDLDVPKGQPVLFNFLQIRPIVESNETIECDWDAISMDELIVYSEMALGNGIIQGISDIIYVKPDTFKAAESEQIAKEVELLNNTMKKEKRNYILIGPGRWGSSDNWLGIPVKWAQISQARLIVESGLDNYRIDPSQGTHFFHNLTSFRVGYFTVNPYAGQGYYNVDYLTHKESCYENDHLRHIRFNQELKILIDGKKNKGMVFKAQNS
jgi:CheY-like chemotaxis protein